jgi:hypothetical protein
MTGRSGKYKKRTKRGEINLCTNYLARINVNVSSYSLFFSCRKRLVVAMGWVS